MCKIARCYTQRCMPAETKLYRTQQEVDGRCRPECPNKNPKITQLFEKHLTATYEKSVYRVGTVGFHFTVEKLSR